ICLAIIRAHPYWQAPYRRSFFDSGWTKYCLRVGDRLSTPRVDKNTYAHATSSVGRRPCPPLPALRENVNHYSRVTVWKFLTRYVIGVFCKCPQTVPMDYSVVFWRGR